MGLDPEKDIDGIYRLPGGGFVQKKDHALLHETMDRHEKELREAIAADKTGEGFIYQMFLHELNNHEFGYTLDAGDTLDALGYTAGEVLGDARLKHGFEKAKQEALKEYKEWVNL